MYQEKESESYKRKGDDSFMCKYMRSLSCVIAMFLILIIASFAFAAPNLLENPSFEEVDVDGIPVGWGYIRSGAKEHHMFFSVSDEHVVSGNYSGRIEIVEEVAKKREGFFYQVVPIEEGRLYKISFNYLRDNIARVMPNIIFYESYTDYATNVKSSNVDTSCIYDHSQLESDLAWGTNNGAINFGDINSTPDGEWIHRWIIVDPPAGTNYIGFWTNIKGGVVSTSRRGNIYWDDICIQEYVDMDFYYSVDTDTNTITLTEACYPALNSLGANYMWEWDLGDGNTSFDLNPTHTYDSVDEYTVTLTLKKDGQILSSVSKTFIAIPIEKTFVPGPNPVSDILSIYYDITSPASLRVYNISGNAVLNVELGDSNPYKWDLTDDNGDRVPRGFYIVQIVYETGEVAETHTVYVSN